MFFGGGQPLQTQAGRPDAHLAQLGDNFVAVVAIAAKTIDNSRLPFAGGDGQRVLAANGTGGFAGLAVTVEYVDYRQNCCIEFVRHSLCFRTTDHTAS